MFIGLRSQSYVESNQPDAIPAGIVPQAGPGDGNSTNWTYPYGTKLTVNIGNYRNFEICTSTYPNGDLLFRQYYPQGGSWDPWRKILMYNANGNIAIGDISPIAKLDVNYLGTGDRVMIHSLQSSNNNASGLFENNGGSGSGLLIKAGAGGHEYPIFNAMTWAGISRFYVRGDGNIGIGTTSPQNLLDVKGTIHAQEVKVDMNNWSDFVFHPSYQLKPLTEVEQFIKNNGHLQDIPSAAEVEQNGVNVGEMQKKLLQKVEELTLYTIEQNKKLEEQAKINAMLIKRIDEMEKGMKTK